MLVFGVACVGGPGTEHDEQLRGLGLNIEGFNVLHDAAPSTEAGTDLGRVAVGMGGFLGPELRRLQVVDPAGAGWTLDSFGDAFQLVANGGFLTGFHCAPPSVGVHEGHLQLTSNTQPGRVFRVPLRCEGVDGVRHLPFHGHSIDGDTVLGNTFQFQGETALVDLPSDTVTPLGFTAQRFAEPGLRNGGFAGVDGLGGFVYDGARTDLPEAPAAAMWASSDQAVVLYTTGSQVYRVDGDTSTPIGDSGLFLDLLWADEDGRFAVTTTGNQGWPLRDLFLVDTELDVTIPFTRPDGELWSSGWGTRGLVLSQDRTEMLLPYSSFGDASLERVDVATGESIDLLGKVRDHLLVVDAPYANLTAYDVTPDFRYAGVVLDNVTADPGGFRQDYSGAYVIDLDDGRTWLVSVDGAGRTIDFAYDGFNGRLIEHIALSPDAQRVLYGYDYVADRSAWVELP